MRPISEKLSSKKAFENELLSKWEVVIPILKEKYVIATTDITARAAEAYIGDLIGLFKNEIHIPEEFIYPHIRINGYNSGYDYDSNKLTFNLLDNEVLGNYLRLFKNSIKAEHRERSNING